MEWTKRMKEGESEMKRLSSPTPYTKPPIKGKPNFLKRQRRNGMLFIIQK